VCACTMHGSRSRGVEVLFFCTLFFDASRWAAGHSPFMPVFGQECDTEPSQPVLGAGGFVWAVRGLACSLLPLRALSQPHGSPNPMAARISILNPLSLCRHNTNMARLILTALAALLASTSSALGGGAPPPPPAAPAAPGGWTAASLFLLAEADALLETRRRPRPVFLY